ncbi:unnamed protein product, partial [Gongylonema pulchrum]
MRDPEFWLQCYGMMVLHAYKYPHRPVVGILVGRLTRTNLFIIEHAVPVLHESATLGMVMELALVSVETYCNMGKNSVVGVYFCNETLSDNSLDHNAVRVAEKI